MASMRAIRPEIFEDEFIGNLDYFHRWLWIGLFAAVADDQGRFWLNRLKIRAILFVHPKDSQVTDEMIVESVDIFEKANKLHVYRKGGKNICQIVSWWKHQKPRWATRSDYPPPDKWQDRERFHAGYKEISETNWKLPGGFARAEPTPNTNGSPAHNLYIENIGLISPFEEEALNQAISKYTQEWVVKSIEIAVKNNVKKLSYIIAILENWGKNGQPNVTKKEMYSLYLEDEFAEW